FNTAYGLALFGGAAVMGWLYGRNQIGAILAFTCATEAVAILLYFRMNRLVKASRS
ncbi:MAG TPA: MFS transporter, partial [Ruminococcaceae bacterium]|nr:MFS transporter [Oscillospiraceae bacterium]